VFHKSQWGFDVPLFLMFQSREGILLCTGQEGTGRARDNARHVKGRKKVSRISGPRVYFSDGLLLRSAVYLNLGYKSEVLDASNQLYYVLPSSSKPLIFYTNFNHSSY
jgi:hypothetical protein